MAPILTAFAASPDRGRGLARDMRVRWASEEAGLPHDTRLTPLADLKAPPHLARNPFGQIPTWEDGDLTLFESGAIVLRIAQDCPVLLPEAELPRARTIAWMFAAVATMEPALFDISLTDIVEREQPWYTARRTMLIERARIRLAELVAWLKGREWLEGRFTAGDLMMISVLRRGAALDLFSDQPELNAYVQRGEARPAFARAFAAQKAAYEATIGGLR